MDKDSNMLAGSLLDLAERAYRNNCYTFTRFMGDAELSVFYGIERSLPPCGYELYGGHDAAVRFMIRFGTPETLGYEQPWPVSLIRIRPLSQKFSEDLSHRDILGALMHQGINRSEIGDILTGTKEACFFCSDRLADTLCRDLVRIRHTTVVCEISDTIPEGCEQTFDSKEIQVSSSRVDGVVSKFTNLSRSKVTELFSDGKVFINGRQCMSHSSILKPGDRISVRGFGKFIFCGVSRTTRKGNLVAEIKIYT